MAFSRPFKEDRLALPLSKHMCVGLGRRGGGVDSEERGSRGTVVDATLSPPERL